MSRIEKSITLLERDYTIRCDEQDATLLEKASIYLNQQMHAIQRTGRNDTREIAVLAALNTTKELLSQQKNLCGEVNLEQRIKALQTDIHQALES